MNNKTVEQDVDNWYVGVQECNVPQSVIVCGTVGPSRNG